MMSAPACTLVLSSLNTAVGACAHVHMLIGLDPPSPTWGVSAAAVAASLATRLGARVGARLGARLVAGLVARLVAGLVARLVARLGARLGAWLVARLGAGLVATRSGLATPQVATPQLP